MSYPHGREHEKSYILNPRPLRTRSRRGAITWESWIVLRGQLRPGVRKSHTKSNCALCSPFHPPHARWNATAREGAQCLLCACRAHATWRKTVVSPAQQPSPGALQQMRVTRSQKIGLLQKPKTRFCFSKILYNT